MLGDRKADRVAHDLMRRVVSGEVEVGSILPREAELATGYGVNRGVVREAIKLLEVHRLVRPVRRRGTEVLSPLASLSPDVLRVMLSPRPGEVDPDVLRDVLEIRALLDEHLCALAARRRTEADLEALEAQLARVAAAKHDPARFAERRAELMLGLAAATHNRVFRMLVSWHRSVQVDLDALFVAASPPAEPHLAGLRLLVDLVRAGDAEQVRELVSAFHRWSTPRLLAVAAMSAGRSLSEAMEVAT